MRPIRAVGLAIAWSWRRGLVLFLIRLGLAIGALAFIHTGAEALYRGVGYLVVGALVWIEIRSRPGRKKSEGAEEE